MNFVQVLTKLRNTNYKKIILLQLLLIFFIGCKYQSQDLLNTKLVIDQQELKDGVYKSKNLDKLFNIQNVTYFEPDYTGTSFDNYYVKNIILIKSKSNKSHYLLIFDNKDILKDTLKIPNNEVYSLNVKFENNKNGIAIGTFDKKASYFKINKNIELDNNLKLKPLAFNTKIDECPLPIEFLSEDNVGIEEHYKYGTKSVTTERSNISQNSPNDELSQWSGEYNAKFEISRIEDDFTLTYLINILNKNTISITEQINSKKNEIKDLYIHSLTNNKLIIKSKSDSTLEFIINKTDNEFYLAGNTIYLLNPPNNNYPMKKIK